MLGTLRLVIAPASTWFTHMMVGSEYNSIKFSVGAGDAFKMEMPSLNFRSAAKDICTGVSNWTTKTCEIGENKKRLTFMRWACV